MPIDWDREQVFWDVTAWAELPEDWLDTVIRRVLRLSAGKAEPPLAAWVRIQQNIEAVAPSLLHQEEDRS